MRLASGIQAFKLQLPAVRVSCKFRSTTSMPDRMDAQPKASVILASDNELAAGQLHAATEDAFTSLPVKVLPLTTVRAQPFGRILVT